MSFDLFGPGLLALGTTDRPGESRVDGTADTWFQDCTSPEADDGTEYQSAFFNAMLAYTRVLVRANGNTALAAAIIAETNSDDTILLRSIQHLMQRGLTNYAVDSGTADAIVVALTPALAEYKPGGAPIWILKGAAANTTTTPVCNINGLGNKTIVRIDGSPLDIGELAANKPFAVVPDGTNLRLTSPARSATKAEVEAGVISGAFVSPATLFSHRIPYFIATGGAPQTIPTGVETKITGLSVGTSFFNAGSSFGSSQFTCGAKDAGAWFFIGYSALELLTDSGAGHDYRTSVAVNGTAGPFQSCYIKETSTYGAQSQFGFIIEDGDVVDLRAFQNTGVNRNTGAVSLFGFRLSGVV